MNDIRPDWIVLIITVIAGLWVSKKQPYPYLKSIPYFLLFTLVIELLGRYFRLRSINNVLLFNYYSVTQIVYFSYCFHQILNRKYIRKLMFILPTICILNIHFIQGIKTFHTYSLAICVLAMAIFAVNYYVKTYKETEVDNLLTEPDFWFTTGVLLYFTTTLSIVGIMNYIAVLPPEIIQLIRKTLLNVSALFYLILLIALVCRISFRKSISNS